MKTERNGFFLLTTILMLLFFGACRKDKNNLPVDFELKFSINDEDILGGAITIDEIGISLNSIDIRGIREQGDDVFLTRSFPQGKNFILKTSLNSNSEHLDIPEGIYNPLLFSLKYKKDEEEKDLIEDINEWLEDVKDEDEDLEGLQEDLGDIIEDYLEDITPCIFVKGKFMHNNAIKNLVIVVNDPLIFQVFSKNVNNEQKLLLERGIPHEGNLKFDPSYWFEAITPSILNEAFIGKIEGEDYIFLSKYVNGELYKAIFNRMEESTVLRIN